MAAKESEKVTETHLCDSIEALGGWAIKMIPTEQKGLPDRLCLLPGNRIFFCEVKTEGKKMEPMQRRVAKRLIGMDCDHYVPDTKASVDQIIEGQLAVKRLTVEDLLPAMDRYFGDDFEYRRQFTNHLYNIFKLTR